jgi:hypothetical protein
MDNREFNSALEALRRDGVAIEKWLDADPALLSSWASWQRGEARIPRIRARQVAWLLKMQEDGRRLAAAKLPTCEWTEQRDEKYHELASRPNGLSPADIDAYFAERKTHLARCAICSSNEQWAADNLSRSGLFPRTGIGGALCNILGRIPDPLFPAAMAAVFVGGPVTQTW